MGHGEQVGELRALLRRRTAERLKRDHGLEQSVAESAAELIEVGFGEGLAVGEMRHQLAEAERLGTVYVQPWRDHAARLIASKKRALARGEESHAR